MAIPAKIGGVLKSTITILREGGWPFLLYRLQMKWNKIDLGYVSVNDLGSSEDRSNYHLASGGPGLEIILRSLFISNTDQIVDLGCGKAGAMLTMALFPFAKIDGVEISEILVQVARQNLDRMKITNAEVFLSDASTFEDLDRYTFVYMYYPFPRPVTQAVLQNLIRSFERRQRKLTLIFNNSVDHDLIMAHGFKVEAMFGHLPSPHPAYVYSLTRAGKKD